METCWQPMDALRSTPGMRILVSLGDGLNVISCKVDTMGIILDTWGGTPLHVGGWPNAAWSPCPEPHIVEREE